jgi:hypothetical protein
VCEPTADSRQQTADGRQQTADSRQQTADSRQQTADSRQQTADSRQQTVCILVVAAGMAGLCVCELTADSRQNQRREREEKGKNFLLLKKTAEHCVALLKALDDTP